MTVLPLLALVAAAADKPAAALTPIPLAELKRTAPVSYEKEVQPLFAAKCTVCHSGTELRGKFDMGTFASMMKGGKRGPSIVPGKAEESLLWLMSGHRKGPIMPPKNEDNPLTSQEVTLLKLWIDQGAKGPAVDAKVRPTVVVGLPPASVKPVRAVAVAGEKDATIVAAGRGNRVLVFEGKKGDFVRELTDPTLKTPDGKPVPVAHLSLVESMAFSPDGKTLATGSYREVTLWDAEKGTVKKRLVGFADRVVAIAFSPDGKLFATGGGAPTDDGEIKLFDASTGAVVTDIKGGHSDTVFGVAFSPDGKLLATSAADKFVKVFEVPGGKFVKSFEGHTNHVLDVGWSPDGKKLVSAGADNAVKVWDYEKGEKLKDLQNHSKQVTRLVFVGKSPKFLTAGGDATVRQWSVDGGQEKQYAGGKDFVYAVSASADGTIVAAGGEEGVVRLYNGTNGQQVKAMVPPEEEPKPDPAKSAPVKDPKKK